MHRLILSFVAGAALLASTAPHALASQTPQQIRECDRLFAQTRDLRNPETASKAYAKYVALGCPTLTGS